MVNCERMFTLTLSPNGNPTSAIPNDRVPSYILLNLRGGYWFWDKQAELAVSVYNTLNHRHREYPTGPVIGSRVMGWFTLKLYGESNLDIYSFHRKAPFHSCWAVEFPHYDEEHSPGHDQSVVATSPFMFTWQ